MSRLPVVAIVGRPNVGKSTLLNRILGRREAIVEERPGVTRDRKDIEANWLGQTFRLIDTGGWTAGGDSLDEKVSRQSERAVREADLVLLVVDATVGITEEDSRVAAWLRRAGVKVLLVANKVDDQRHEAAVWDLLTLGVGEPVPVSALHGRGSGDLLDEIVGQLPSEHEMAEGAAEMVEAPAELAPPDDDVLDATSVAIVGRPNAGKSTLFNRLVGDDRSVVHDMPGTTRDSIDTVIETDVGTIRLIDTAGMRRRAKVSGGTEYYSVVRALEAVDKADVALLVIDAEVGVTAQDQRLAERVDASGCPIVVILNKWEQLDAEDRAERRWQVGDRLGFIGEAPILQISALTGKGVQKLIPALGASIDAYRRRVPTRKVNEVVQAAQEAQPAPGGARVLYATQGASNPPTFTLFVSREVPRTYLRYLERKLREAFGLGATAIKLRVRRRSA